MGRLFRYILRNNYVFLFILLESFAFFLVVQNNYQRATFIKSANGVTGGLMNTVNNISSYFHLAEANTALQEENKQLRQQLNSAFLFRDSSDYFQTDTLFTFINARVIRNTIGRQKNFFFLDMGRSQGIQENMGVIGTSGVAGIVVEATDNFSRAMSLLNIQSRINAKIKKNNHLGIIKWSGDDYRKVWLTDIPQHVSLKKGDTIITSGNSQIFPEGIIIGLLSGEFRNESQKFKDAALELAIDFNNLEYVMVINNMYIKELDSLNAPENE